MHDVGALGVAGVLAFWAEPGCEAATIRRAKSPIANFCMVGGSNVRWLRVRASLAFMDTAVPRGTILEFFPVI
jgi:hypothetical protein